MSDDNSDGSGTYEFDYENTSKSKMRSFRTNNKLSKLLENTAIADDMVSHGTEYDNLKAKMRAKYLTSTSIVDSKHVSSTVNQLQETLVKTKNLLKSFENKETKYHKSLSETTKDIKTAEEDESDKSSEDVFEETKEDSPEVIDLELDDEMIDEVIEEAENEESEESESVSSVFIENEDQISEKTANSNKYQLKFESESEHEDAIELDESDVDKSEQKSIFGQVSSIFDTESKFSNNKTEYDESYEEKMKSIQASISKKLEKEAKENEISDKNKEISKLIGVEKGLDEKIKEQHDIISSIEQKIFEKETTFQGLKEDYVQYLKDLKSKDSLISQYRNYFTATQGKLDNLVNTLEHKLENGKNIVSKLQNTHNTIDTYLESSAKVLNNVKECRKMFVDQDISNWHALSEQSNTFYQGVMAKLENYDFSHYTPTEKSILHKVVEEFKEQKKTIDNKIGEKAKDFEVTHPSSITHDHKEFQNKTNIKEEESFQGGNTESDLNTDESSNNKHNDESSNFDLKQHDINSGSGEANDASVDVSTDENDLSIESAEESEEEDAIARFYKDNNIKEGELLKTVVSQAISAPMEVPEAETLTTRQNSIRLYNKLTDNIKDKISSTISSVKSSIPNTFSLKRKRQSVTEIDSNNNEDELDESDIEKIENTFIKRVKQSDGRYRVVKTYVNDINKGDLIKHPALLNPEDEDEQIEYITLIREKLVTNPTDEVIIISSDED